MKSHFQNQLVIAGALLLLVSGCASATPTPETKTRTEPSNSIALNNYKTYETTGKEATISYPADWEPDTQNPQTIAQIYAPYEDPTDSFRENLNIISTDLSQYTVTLEELFKENRSQAAEFENYQEVEYVDTSIDGNPAKRLVYTASVTDGAGRLVNLQFLQALTLKNKRSFVITCTFKENSFDKYVETCKKMIESVKLR